MSQNRDDVYSRLKVMQSAAGWYVGRSCFEQGVEMPGSRESGYYKDAAAALRRLVAFLKDEGDLDSMIKHTLAGLAGGNNAAVFDVLTQDAIAQACLKEWELPDSALANVNRLVAYYEQHIDEIDLETPADVSLDGSSLYASPLGVALEGYDGNATVEDLYDDDEAFASVLVEHIPGFEYPDFSHMTVGQVIRMAEKQYKDAMPSAAVDVAQAAPASNGMTPEVSALLIGGGHHGVVLYKLVENEIKDLGDEEVGRALENVVAPNKCFQVAKELISAGMTYNLPKALIAIRRKEIELDRELGQVDSDSYTTLNELRSAGTILSAIGTALFKGETEIDLREDWDPDDYDDGSLDYEMDKKKACLGRVMDVINFVEKCGFHIDHELVQSQPTGLPEIQAANRLVSAQSSSPWLG